VLVEESARQLSVQTGSGCEFIFGKKVKMNVRTMKEERVKNFI
jgi:hypothetical protein